MDDPARTVDTAWLRAAASAIAEEFNYRLKLDEDVVEFAETLASLHEMTQEFLRPRMHLLEED
jgi:hypothetical protein